MRKLGLNLFNFQKKLSALIKVHDGYVIYLFLLFY